MVWDSYMIRVSAWIGTIPAPKSDPKVEKTSMCLAPFSAI